MSNRPTTRTATLFGRTIRTPRPRLIAAAAIAITLFVARELASEFAFDWLKDNLGLFGDFFAWRWSSVLLALIGAISVLAIWEALDRSASASAPASPSEDIVLLEPIDGAKVGRIFTVHGYARTFEGNVVVERLTRDGTWEASGITTAGMMEGHTSFSLQIGLSPGNHLLRVGRGALRMERGQASRSALWSKTEKGRECG